LANKAMLQLEYTQWYNERVKRGEQLKDAAAETEVINVERKRLGLPIEPGIAWEAQAHEAAAKVSTERDDAIAKLDKQIAEIVKLRDEIRACADAQCSVLALDAQQARRPQRAGCDRVMRTHQMP